MWSLIQDTLATMRLKSRCRRLLQEQVLSLVERRHGEPVLPDPGSWSLLSKQQPGEAERQDLRKHARRLSETNSYARNLLRLLEIYVTGPGLKLTPNPLPGRDVPTEELRQLDQLWRQFLQHNRQHFSYREFARRVWRDGETFVRLFPQPGWPPTIRFIDPECITDPERGEEGGVLSDPDDVETIVGYRRCDPVSGEILEEIPAANLLHTKLGADSNEPRGTTWLAPVLAPLQSFESWLETELRARQLQASIVLWRKVQGSPGQVTSYVGEAGHGRGREKYAPGSILTTSMGTDLKFLQPKTNLGDAIPLGRLLLLSVAAGAGLPEHMVSSDASNASYASTMVAEGPAVKLFESEQQFFAAEFERLWIWVIGQAVEQGLIPADTLERVEASWSFPALVNRDRPRERLADVQLVSAGVLSRAEVARRDNADPLAMRRELARENTADLPAGNRAAGEV